MGAFFVIATLSFSNAPWPMHVIDQSSKGADGVRMADINDDGRLDIVTGWEEGGDIRVCTHPGAKSVREPWPSFSVGTVPKPEDAVMVDLNHDGALDVVSCTEGEDRTVYVHWNPASSGRAWRAEPVPVLQKQSAWMFCAPLPAAGSESISLAIGSKNPNGQIGLLNVTPGKANTWTWRTLRKAGWVMSLVTEDMDADGDSDILCSDRREAASGVFWLENPGGGGNWNEHAIGAQGREVMFLSSGDLDGDGDRDVVAAVKPREIAVFFRDNATGSKWRTETVTYSDSFGTAKVVRTGDVDGDGKADLVVTCEHAETSSGVFWLSHGANATWTAHDIAGAPGIKYDLVELVDLDADGDLDAVTCEEREINAVLWYENPVHP
ncbi:MAG: VCBS repeat-containing protein [Candidatus Hydrogenedentes bacterium]|nr:VCBS repeat-containing protein [Candidatus Hydrogenedentota bacterium]